MENEAEVIRKQMEETRTSLSEKLEALETQVTDTVKETTESVGETVETVTEAVKDTASSVAQTVQAVTETFNISAHVQRNPWLAMGCSAGAGFLLGLWLTPSRSTALSGMTSGTTPSSTPSSAPSANPWPSASPTPAPPEPARAPESFNGHAGAQEPARENPWQALFDSWKPMFDQLKGLALGATVGVAGQMLVKALPESLRKDVNEMLTGVTKAMGGTPLWSENDQQQQRSPNGSSGSATSGGSSTPAESGARGFERNPAH
jgi:ElaB/YqjD/DUF883 family membrane-anchored ribosome-binding protein